MFVHTQTSYPQHNPRNSIHAVTCIHIRTASRKFTLGASLLRHQTEFNAIADRTLRSRVKVALIRDSYGYNLKFIGGRRCPNIAVITRDLLCKSVSDNGPGCLWDCLGTATINFVCYSTVKLRRAIISIRCFRRCVF